MLKRLYAHALLIATALVVPSTHAQSPTWSAETAVSKMKEVGTAGATVGIQGISTVRYWMLIGSAIAFACFLAAAVFGHFKLGWGTKWLFGTLFLAMFSAVVAIFTGLTLVF